MTIASWIATGILAGASIGLLIARDWRMSLGLLGVQYLGVFWLSGQYWPLSMAAVKLVTGWMCIAILGVTRLGLGQEEPGTEAFWTQGRLFRVFAAGIVMVIVFASAPRVENIIPGIGLPVVFGSLSLLGLGILHLGIIAQPFRVILGLLTVLSGFETIYAALESSILVAAMLSAVDLGLALVGAYLLVAQKSELGE
ncbi:MAG: hypothetical protein ACOYYU_12475 [Chloroflexota bacterium]